ncbi:MAG: hypothetical protein NZ839_04270, partial [Endomicrobia bacterium]|nr:hypothetical protein [Endomicrobiia bacterium]
MKYSNSEIELDVVEKSIDEVIKEYQEFFQRSEDVETGLVVSLPDIWQFSLIIYLSFLVSKFAENDLRNFLDLFNEE